MTRIIVVAIVLALVAGDAAACRHRRGGGGGGSSGSYAASPVANPGGTYAWVPDNAGGSTYAFVPYNTLPQGAIQQATVYGMPSGNLGGLSPFIDGQPDPRVARPGTLQPGQRLPGRGGAEASAEPPQEKRFPPGTIWRADANGKLQPYTPPPPAKDR